MERKSTMEFGANSSGSLQGFGTGSTGSSFGTVPSAFGTGAPIFGSVSSFGTGAPVFGTASANFGSMVMASSSTPSVTPSFSNLLNSSGSGFALSTAPVSNGSNGGTSSAASESSSTFPLLGTGSAQGSNVSTSTTSSTHSFTGFCNAFTTSGTGALSNREVSTSGASAAVSSSSSTFATIRGSSAPQFGTGATVFGRFTHNTPGSGPAFPAFGNSSTNLLMSTAAASSTPFPTGSYSPVSGLSSVASMSSPVRFASTAWESSSTFPLFGTGFGQVSLSTASTSTTSSTHSFTGFANPFATSGVNASSNMEVSTAGATAAISSSSSTFATITTAPAPQFGTGSTVFGRFTHNTPAFGPAFPAFGTTAASASTTSSLLSTVASAPTRFSFGNSPMSSSVQTSSTAVTTSAPLATTITSGHPFSPTRFIVSRENPSTLNTSTPTTQSAPLETQFTVTISVAAPEQAQVSVGVSEPAPAPQLCQKCGHKVTAYSPTPEENGTSHLYTSISAMPEYADMSHEELRWAVHPSRVNAASRGNYGFTCIF